MTYVQPETLLPLSKAPASLPPKDFHSYALGYLETKLTSYGNQISSDHHTALSALCELADKLLTKDLTGRIRFGLPCGMGKTTGVRAILRAIHVLNLKYRVVVASSKIEELCRLLRTLEREDGIPRSKLGIQHSAMHDPCRADAGQSGYASEPSGNHGAKFLLVTHQNVRSGQSRPWMKNCDLVLFDESLVVGASQILPFSNLGAASVRAEVGALTAMSQDFSQLRPAVDILERLMASLDAATSEAMPGPVRIARADAVDATELAECRQILSSVGGGHELIDQLLEWAEQATELRVFSDGKKSVSLISYSITVPDELQQVIVLDASDPIRELVHHDPRMMKAEDVLPSLSEIRQFPGGLASIKYHSRVQIHFANDPGSRSTMSRDFAGDVKPWALEKLVRLVKSRPDEGFLVVTFKQRGSHADFRRIILKCLHEAGVDPDERVREGVCRVSILTWGHETGTNLFSEYENVVLLGVMFQPKPALAGVYLGQRDDLRCPQMDSLVRDLVYSECRHAIYQAINRIRVRKVDVVDGLTQAQPCNVYVWHHDPRLEESLSPVLRGCPRWRPWREEDEDKSTSDVSMTIGIELDRLYGQGVRKIALGKLKRSVGPMVPSTTWRRAWRELLDVGCGWMKVGSSLEVIF